MPSTTAPETRWTENLITKLRDQSPALAGAVSDWRIELQSTQKTHSTIRNYIECVTSFGLFLIEQHQVTDPAEITHQHVKLFAIALREQGRKPSVVVLRVGRVKTWLAYLHRTKWIESNPGAHIKLDRFEPTPMQILTADEWTRLLDTCKGNSAKDARDRLILLLMGDSGLRRSEVGKLDQTDYNPIRHTVLVRESKRNKTREVSIGPKTEQALNRYLRHRAHNPLAHMPALILPWRTDHRANGRVSGAAVFLILKNRLRQANITKQIHPHSLRHTAAARLKMQKAPEIAMMNHFGWEDVKMLRRYGRLVETDSSVAVMGELLAGH